MNDAASSRSRPAGSPKVCSASCWQTRAACRSSPLCASTSESRKVASTRSVGRSGPSSGSSASFSWLTVATGSVSRAEQPSS